MKETKRKGGKVDMLTWCFAALAVSNAACFVNLIGLALKDEGTLAAVDAGLAVANILCAVVMVRVFIRRWKDER